MNHKESSNCIQTKIVFSVETGETKSVGWRCKKVITCSYCRGIEASKLRNAMRQAEGNIYVIEKDKWNAYRQKMKRENSDGYIRIPQENGVLIVYSNIEPNGDYAVLARLSTEQLLANRLNKDAKGIVARTGVFAKEGDEATKEDAGSDEVVTVSIPLPLFRYKESKEIMPLNETIWTIRALAYRESPYTEITKDNAEKHMRFVANFIIAAMTTEPRFFGVIEPLIYRVEKDVPVSNFANWIDGADVKMSGIKNKFSDPIMQRMDDLIMNNGGEPFDYVKHCEDNGLVYDPSGYRKAQRELDEMNRKMFEDMGFTQ